jgi:hypothetical protein
VSKYGRCVCNTTAVHTLIGSHIKPKHHSILYEMKDTLFPSVPQSKYGLIIAIKNCAHAKRNKYISLSLHLSILIGNWRNECYLFLLQYGCT